MRKVTVQVDNREQQPILFPPKVIWSPEPRKHELLHVQVEKVALTAGDYRMKRWPRLVGVERKKGFTEIAHNLLTTDRYRFCKAWLRFLSAYRYPVLFLEGTFPGLSMKIDHGGQNVGYEAVRTFSELIFLAPNLRVLWVPDTTKSVHRRRAVGAQLIRMMMHPTRMKGDPNG